MHPGIAKLLQKVELSEIASIRGVLNRIVEIVNDPDSSAFDLKNAIETDPPLSARVLKRANSSFYGISHKGSGITDVHSAIVCIGFETIKEIALSQSVCKLFRNDEAFCGFSRPALWEHCVATAIAGRLIFRREFGLPGGQAHAAGLLHDLGVIVEDQCAPQAFRQVLQAFQLSPRDGLYAHERAILGFSHAELGAELASLWEFPETLRCAIGAESIPDSIVGSEGDLVSATVRLASWAIQRRRIGFVESPGRTDRDILAAMKLVNVGGRALDLIMEEVDSELGRMRNDGLF